VTAGLDWSCIYCRGSDKN